MPTPPPESDPSNGWESVAHEFIRDARQTNVGVAVVSRWASELPQGSTFLDLGCGPGVRRSDPLHARGTVYAIDASPSLARAYQSRFPEAIVACESAKTSVLFSRQFDAVMSWGLLFLLPVVEQDAVIRRVANGLTSGGRFLFTAPWQIGSWADNSTGRESVSLGRHGYRDLLADAGLRLLAEYDDEGENHYYDSTTT
jgi:2-polyprenyl-3-methyl-5-hydroxy-6-metoxy-1,4-benzoquinol methylase